MFLPEGGNEFDVKDSDDLRNTRR